MPDYEKMYGILFNAITDALEAVYQDHTLHGVYLLEEAQRRAEDLYLASEA